MDYSLMQTEKESFGFPFSIDPTRRVKATGGDEALRGKITQILFTAPGERVHRPDFGCGLFDLVFEPNNDLLAAAVEFTVFQSLSRWLKDEIIVDTVQVSSKNEYVTIEISYTKKVDLNRQSVRIHFK